MQHPSCFLQLSHIFLAGFINSVFGGTSPCWQLILAPFFVAGLISATPKRLCKSWLLVPWQMPNLCNISCWLHDSELQFLVISYTSTKAATGRCSVEASSSSVGLQLADCDYGTAKDTI